MFPLFIHIFSKTYFRVEILNHEIDLSSVRAYVNPPTGIQQPVKLNVNGQGMFVPDKYGMHEIQIEVNEDKSVFNSSCTLLVLFYQLNVKK